jgi:hypothetical protein
LLRTGEMRFSAPRRFNDPWDCRPLFDAQLGDVTARVAIVILWMGLCSQHVDEGDAEKQSAVLAKAFEIARDPSQFDAVATELSDTWQEQLRRRYRLLCLSALPDVPLMWSHYANAHRGVCLVFGAKNPVIGSAWRVEYRDHYPTLPETLHEKDLVPLSFLQKAKYWGYEHEYRAIACGQPKDDADFVQCDKLGYVHGGAQLVTGIIMGCNMPPEDRWEIEQLLNETPRQIDCFQARRRHSDCGLDIVKL